MQKNIHTSICIKSDVCKELEDVYNEAFIIYKQLEMYTRLICERSGLYTSVSRLTSKISQVNCYNIISPVLCWLYYDNFLIHFNRHS